MNRIYRAAAEGSRKKGDTPMKKKIRAVILMIAVILSGLGVPESSKIRTASVASAASTAQGEAVARFAESQVGTKERSAGSDDVIYNDWFYGRRVRNQKSGQYAWCYVFLCYCLDKCGVDVAENDNAVFYKTANCGTGMDFFQHKKRFYTRSSGYTPVAGDIIFINCDSGPGPDHVGLVTGADASRVYYVDGNNTSTSPHSVCRWGRSRNWSQIIGYGNPAYTGGETVEGAGPDEYKVTGLKNGDILSGNAPIRGRVLRGGLYPWLELYMDYGYVSTTCNNQYGNFRFDLDTARYADGYHKLGVKMRNQNGYDYTTWFDIYINNKNEKPTLHSVNVEKASADSAKVTVKASAPCGIQQAILCTRNRTKGESFTNVRMDEQSGGIFTSTFNARSGKGVYDVHLYIIGRNQQQTVKCTEISLGNDDKPTIRSMVIERVRRNVKTTVIADSSAGMQQVILCYRNRSRGEAFTCVRMNEPSAAIYRYTFTAKNAGLYDIHVYAIGRNGQQKVRCDSINVY